LSASISNYPNDLDQGFKTTSYKKSELEPFQAFNDPDHPLEALLPAEQNKILRNLADAIEEAFNRP
jgi:hypothetical protein